MDELVRRLQEKVNILTQSLDALHGTPCEQIRHQQEIEALTARAEAAEARVAELEARLEIDHYFTSDEDGNFTRHEATPEERRALPDKIDCLEDDLELGKGRIASARNKALEDAAKVAEHFRDSCGECNWPEDAVIVGGNVANDISAAIRALKS